MFKHCTRSLDLENISPVTQAPCRRAHTMSSMSRSSGSSYGRAAQQRQVNEAMLKDFESSDPATPLRTVASVPLQRSARSLGSTARWAQFRKV